MSEISLVSVVIPTYNREKYILRAVESVISQTYSNIEAVVVDDCSTDETVKVIEDAMINYPNISLVKHTQNKGGAASRNTGILNSKGQFIAFLDSDCYWLPNKIQKQMDLLLSSGDQYGAIGCGAIYDRDGKKHVAYRTGPFGDIHRNLLKNSSGRKRLSWPGSTPNILIRKECFEKAGMFDEKLASCQEFDLYIRISKYFHFDVVNEPLVVIKDEDDIGISQNLDSRYLGRKRMLEKYAKEWPSFSTVKSSYSSQVGNYLCRSNNMKEGRRYLFDSVTADPFNIKNYFRYLISIFPYPIYMKIYDKIRKMR